MKITETTPTAPPPPRSFTLELDERELRFLRFLVGNSIYSSNLSAGFDEPFTDRVHIELSRVGMLR